VRVKFSSPWQGHHVGDVIDVADEDARRLVNAGYAQYADADTPLVTGPRNIFADYATLQDREVLTWNADTMLAEGVDPATLGGSGPGGGITAETDPVAGPRITAHETAADPHGDRAHGDSVLAAHVSAPDVHGDRAYVNAQLSALTGGTLDVALDTLAEIDAQLRGDESGAAAMQAAINLRALITDLTAETNRAQAAEAANTAAINLRALITDLTAEVARATAAEQANAAAIAANTTAVNNTGGRELAYAFLATSLSQANAADGNAHDIPGLQIGVVGGVRPIKIQLSVVLAISLGTVVAGTVSRFSAVLAEVNADASITSRDTKTNASAIASGQQYYGSFFLTWRFQPVQGQNYTFRAQMLTNKVGLAMGCYGRDVPGVESMIEAVER
jgi:hypothetical protein